MTRDSLLGLLARCAPGLLSATAASAAPLAATIEVPALDVAEYHRPYVAIWIEGADKAVIANVGVWYDVKMKNDEGETWLKDLRQWWRKSGRELDLPIDGVSGPTRPVGVHEVSIPEALLAKLASGTEYTLVVEAAREVGGREVVRLPFTWAADAKIASTAAGKTELGAITLKTK